MEETFSEFVKNRPERGMIIVGESGMGKTTLLVRLASACRKEEKPYRMFNAAELIATPDGSKPTDRRARI